MLMVTCSWSLAHGHMLMVACSHMLLLSPAPPPSPLPIPAAAADHAAAPPLPSPTDRRGGMEESWHSGMGGGGGNTAGSAAASARRGSRAEIGQREADGEDTVAQGREGMGGAAFDSQDPHVEEAVARGLRGMASSSAPLVPAAPFSSLPFPSATPPSPPPPPPSLPPPFSIPPPSSAISSAFRASAACVPPALPLPAHVSEGGAALPCPGHRPGRQQAGRQQVGWQQEEMEASAGGRGWRAAAGRMDVRASREGDGRGCAGVMCCVKERRKKRLVVGEREEVEECEMQEEENEGNKAEKEEGGDEREAERIAEEEGFREECAEEHLGGGKGWWRHVVEALREEERVGERGVVEGCWKVGLGGWEGQEMEEGQQVCGREERDQVKHEEQEEWVRAGRLFTFLHEERGSSNEGSGGRQHRVCGACGCNTERHGVLVARLLCSLGNPPAETSCTFSALPIPSLTPSLMATRTISSMTHGSISSISSLLHLLWHLPTPVPQSSHVHPSSPVVFSLCPITFSHSFLILSIFLPHCRLPLPKHTPPPWGGGGVWEAEKREGQVVSGVTQGHLGPKAARGGGVWETEERELQRGDGGRTGRRKEGSGERKWDAPDVESEGDEGEGEEKWEEKREEREEDRERARHEQ
ncbi:unnamed protein product [Closterium sp. Naga37s-1]|nr:unnamed protein product [Closterium sp. Naga37s-1]